ncbi:alpha/beta fold hydrolase [candidate division KSB3 bacterium]|uniref:Alpha/beta fold hydrolase n=1 Tax=candidate division KSB3 bacterium TaxID=2044937 RepID=A0A9D5Q572_9BACT|nr:alpha/beta fold hydrolase [candidate division KSB3 bacterium]MBD3324013.1 alpha/beta fold hydrolase [candidate division KSB3 bacterium]
MPYVTIEENRIHYISIESINKSMGEGENIFFLHGLGGNIYNWAYQTKYFSETNNVVSLELPGHGRSGGKGGSSIEYYTELLRQFFDIMEMENIVLVGHSMGGVVSLDFAFKFPERVKALGLVATSAKFDIPTQKLMELKNDMESIFGSLDKAKEKMKDIDERLVTNDMMVLLGDVMAVKKFDGTSHLSELTMPTLIIAGADDILAPVSYAEQLHANIKNSDLHIIENAGHIVMVEAYQEFNSVLEEFLLDLLVDSLYGS